MTEDDNTALIEEARKLFSGPISFLKSAPTLDYLPDMAVNDVAFAGRSNVGKSSLLNALTNRNGLARTSNTPGRTQELNFFDVGDPLRFRLVDMPGYGYDVQSLEYLLFLRYLDIHLGGYRIAEYLRIVDIGNKFIGFRLKIRKIDVLIER